MAVAAWQRGALGVLRLVLLGWALACGSVLAQEPGAVPEALVLNSALATVSVDGVQARYPVVTVLR